MSYLNDIPIETSWTTFQGSAETITLYHKQYRLNELHEIIRQCYISVNLDLFCT